MPAHHRLSARESELRTLRLCLLHLRHELGLIRRDHWRRKYNPDQPRVPAGGPGGGQWTSGGGGGVSPAGNPDLPGFGAADGEAGWSSLGEGWSEDGSVFEQAVTDGAGTTIQSEYAASRAAGFDERQTITLPSGDRVSFETTDNVQTIRFGGPDGDLVGRTIWTPSGPEPDATIQPVFAPLIAAPTIIAGGAILFNWQSPQNGSDGQQAVMGFNARDYRPGDGTSGKLELSYSGRVTQEQAESACRYLPDMQARLDDAVAKAGPISDYPSAAVYGTYVHRRLKEQIDSAGYPDLRAEISAYKIAMETGLKPVPYGYAARLRIDAVEYRSDSTMCIYDFKTGKAGLSAPRSYDLGLAGYLSKPGFNRAIVIEVRPRRQ